MSIKLRIKPEGKFFVNGTGWVKNVSKTPMEIIFSEGLDVQREKRLEEKNQ